MSAAATQAGYLYARGRLSGPGSTGKMTQSARITRRASARETRSQERPVAGMNRNRSKRRARRNRSIANGAPTLCHRLHELRLDSVSNLSKKTE